MLKFSIAFALPLFLLPGFAVAESEFSMLPAICAGHGMATAESKPMEHQIPMDEGHAALMAGMEAMNRDMMVGGMAADIDVAFVCAMIPHHQGAISMARAQLKYGKDDWAKDLARKIIAAQEQEIADMTKWLNERSK